MGRNGNALKVSIGRGVVSVAIGEHPAGAVRNELRPELPVVLRPHWGTELCVAKVSAHAGDIPVELPLMWSLLRHRRGACGVGAVWRWSPGEGVSRKPTASAAAGCRAVVPLLPLLPKSLRA